MIAEDRSVLGELSIDGEDTSLYLHDPKWFYIKTKPDTAIKGVLHDRTRVTLFNCGTISSLGSATAFEDRFHFAELAPAYVVAGNRHLANDKPTISKVTFHLDDAEIAFYDHDAIGHALDAAPLIGAVVAGNEEALERKIHTGPYPAVIYFTGTTDLAQVETAIGTVRVIQSPIISNPFPGDYYAGFTKRTLIEIEFEQPQLLGGAISRILSMMRFVEILVGRPQNLDQVTLDTDDDEDQNPLRLIWVRPPHRPKSWEEKRTDTSEVLISVVNDRDEFATVLREWLAKDEERIDARFRFSSGFNHQRTFSIDRLVGAANMFDILPPTAFRVTDELRPEVQMAKLEARKIFRKLADSPERESVLGALARLGRPTLRSKVRDRAALVSNALQTPLPYLDMVTDEAVKCRNHYVHGSLGSFDYAQNTGIRIFLTGVLEFIFAASEFVEMGWNIARWRTQGSTLAHPFNRVLLDWDMYVQHILRLREEQKATSKEA